MSHVPSGELADPAPNSCGGSVRGDGRDVALKGSEALLAQGSTADRRGAFVFYERVDRAKLPPAAVGSLLVLGDLEAFRVPERQAGLVGGNHPRNGKFSSLENDTSEVLQGSIHRSEGINRGGQKGSPIKGRPIGAAKIPFGGGGRRGLWGDLRNQDWKVITAVHVVEARPRKVEKD